MTSDSEYLATGPAGGVVLTGTEAADGEGFSADQGFQAPLGRTAGAGTAALEISTAERSDRLAQMRAGDLGSVHSWELVTAVDGPGTRMTIFLAGCPLRCLYCHNPDTMAMRNGEPVETASLLKRLKRYRRIFKATGGGLTISGGEVLMQPAFAGKLLAGAKEMGIHTTLDTSGFLGANATDEMLANVDLVLLDIKSGDEASYRRATGRALAPTLTFAERLSAKGIAVWVRFVLVPGLTDDPQNIRQVAEHAAKIGTVERVEVLPFHQMGTDKWEALGMDYELKDRRVPTDAEVKAAKQIFRDHGLPVLA